MKRTLLLGIFFVFLSSCSKVLMPYAEDRLCNKGVAYGQCGRISEVYEDSFENPWKYGIKEVP